MSPILSRIISFWFGGAHQPKYAKTRLTKMAAPHGVLSQALLSVSEVLGWSRGRQRRVGHRWGLFRWSLEKDALPPGMATPLLL